MRDVAGAGHQRVDGRECGLDRLALERVAALEVDQRVLELVLAREHACGERLTVGRVYRVLEPAADDPAHGCVDHSPHRPMARAIELFTGNRARRLE